VLSIIVTAMIAYGVSKTQIKGMKVLNFSSCSRYTSAADSSPFIC
jgi:ABC-type glycerol-3-phosphate transport system permease component